ncbi:ROK family protein [Microlunatus sp. GCM10028923]|uniref:ROK family transcriptional regulator n=1 Tax=Microlunatus sp. GCM10028923 TaxID=3273400 RepID=UPI00360F9F06
MIENGSATPALLRRLNAARVLDALRSESALTVVELLQRSGLSRATLDAVLDDLSRVGLIGPAQDPTGVARGRGRPQRRLRFRGESGHVLGIDIGAHRLEAVVADLAGTVVAQRTASLTPELSRARRIRTARKLAADALGEAGATVPRAVGIGSPGIVDPATGTVRYCNAMTQWSKFALADTLANALGAPAVVENDANLAAIGEHWHGVAQDHADVVYLMAGDRVGSGILIGGELVRGTSGGTGEMAFLGLLRHGDPDEPLEQLVTEIVDAAIDELIAQKAVRTDAVRVLMRDLEPLHGVQVPDLERWLGAVQAGRSGARREFRTALVRYCRVGLVVATLISPELLVIGGRAAEAADVVVPTLRTVLDRLVGPGVRPPRVVASELGSWGVALGAVRIALDRAERTLLDALD